MTGSAYAHGRRCPALLIPALTAIYSPRISRSPGGKAGYKQLIRELGLGGGRERRLLVEQLTAMVARGELVALREGLWAIPKPESTTTSTPQARDTGRPKWDGMEAAARSGRDRLLSGRLDLHRDGFGFVRPEAGSASAQKLEDIFIPPNEINGAMQGDLVLVDEAPPGRDGRRSGRIARVLTRRNPTVVGIFHYARPQGRRGGRDHDFNDAGMSENYVTPLDERISGMIAIPEGRGGCGFDGRFSPQNAGGRGAEAGPGMEWWRGREADSLRE